MQSKTFFLHTSSSTYFSYTYVVICFYLAHYQLLVDMSQYPHNCIESQHFGKRIVQSINIIL